MTVQEFLPIFHRVMQHFQYSPQDATVVWQALVRNRSGHLSTSAVNAYASIANSLRERH